MIRYARLRPGRGFRLRRAIAYYAQRVVTVRGVRRGVRRCLAAAVRLRQGAGSPGPAEPRVAHAVAALERDGLARLADLVPPAEVATILAYFRDRKVIGPDGCAVVLSELPPGTAMAAYPLATVVRCPGLMEAVNAPEILGVASRYLGCKPTISSLGVRWSFPPEGGGETTQCFHRDLDDWRSLKLFVYLTDVDAEGGPHVYAAGSHLTAAGLRAQLYAQPMVERRFGTENLWTMTGPRGTTFMADVHGIHRGVPPRHKPRLILQAQYSLLPIFAFEYEPVAHPAAHGLDAYVNRLLVVRRVCPQACRPPPASGDAQRKVVIARS